MAAGTVTLTGVLHGRTIELDREPGLPEGQALQVTMKPMQDGRKGLAPGEGLRRAFGAWAADGEELDEFLEWNRRQRKAGRPETDP